MDINKEKIYLEFIGINGSGKTTLAKRLALVLKNNGCDVLLDNDNYTSNKINKFIKFINYYFKNIDSINECFVLYSSKDYGYRGSFGNLFIKKFKKERLLNKNFDYLINSEGTLQLYKYHGNYIRNIKSLPNYHTIMQYKKFNFLPVVVHLSLDAEIAVDRCAKVRPSHSKPSEWSLHNYKYSQQLKILNKWNQRLTQVIPYLKNNKIIVITIDSTKSENENLKIILNSINNLKRLDLKD